MTKDLSYLSYPLPPDIQRLFEAGDFDRMARVIRQRLEDPRVPKTLHERLRFQLIIAKEIPEYYRLTQADMLAILQENINDFTEDELEALRDDGTLDWRYINGEVHFRNNCLDALLKVRKEYALRAKDPEVQAAADARGQRLNAMITRMKEEGSMHVRFELHEEMTVKSDRLTPGETLRIHLPLPVVGAQVKSAALLSTSHPATFIAPADEPQRTVYFELPYEPGMTVSAELAYEIEAPYCQPHAREVLAEQPTFDTEEMPPHVVFTPYLTVTNLPEYFMSGLRGDCGVQAITFITLCRLCGIPAKWQAGLYTKPDDAGHHDWARFYIAPYGWLYADCSFGGSAFRAGDLDRWNFYFGNLEPWRLPMCSDFQQEFNPPRRFIRYDPYDNQGGEIESLTRALDDDEYDTSRRVTLYEEL